MICGLCGGNFDKLILWTHKRKFLFFWKTIDRFMVCEGCMMKQLREAVDEGQ